MTGGGVPEWIRVPRSHSIQGDKRNGGKRDGSEKWRAVEIRSRNS